MSISFFLILVLFTRITTQSAVGYCQFRGTSLDPNIIGFAIFTETADEKIDVTIEVSGITQNLGVKHGIHVHEFGDLTDQQEGKSAGGHFNPSGKLHGCPEVNGTSRHDGDMGNWFVDSEGQVKNSKQLDLLKLKGPNSIIGRSVIIHNETDTCSGPLGNAGTRLAFCVIGIRNTDGNTAAANQEKSSQLWNAVCNLQPTLNNQANGTIWFSQISQDGSSSILGSVYNLVGGHGLHVHQFGDLSGPTGMQTGSHYDPLKTNTHAMPPISNRHAGDLGNIYFYDKEGIAWYSDSNNELVFLNGEHNIVGRSVILHSIYDDCSGVYGGRIAQCVIGISKGPTSIKPSQSIPTAQNTSLCHSPGFRTQDNDSLNSGKEILLAIMIVGGLILAVLFLKLFVDRNKKGPKVDKNSDIEDEEELLKRWN